SQTPPARRLISGLRATSLCLVTPKRSHARSHRLACRYGSFLEQKVAGLSSIPRPAGAPADTDINPLSPPFCVIHEDPGTAAPCPGRAPTRSVAARADCRDYENGR